MNDFFDIFLPACASIIFIMVVMGVPFLFAAYTRRLKHTEMMKMAELGLAKAPDTSNGNGKNTLRWGIVVTALGLALCIGLYPIGFVVETGFPLNFGPWMVVGLLPTFFGLALVLIYYLTADRKSKEEDGEE
ncbi:MAG: hypothetical protein EPO32_07360 [Anaerolineae bacterium]|nr:MAG: hypothetical protein EPO32_07360 [Anaerolineae bacterium]